MEKDIIHRERNIGDTRVLTPGRVVGQRGPLVEVLRTSGDDSDARLLTVTVMGWGVYDSDVPGNPSAPRGPLFTTVEWGIKGARSEVELDLPAGGVVFSVVASMVRVSARYDGLVVVSGLQLDPLAVGGADPRPRQRVGAMVGDGAYGRGARLTRTFRLEDLAPPGPEASPPNTTPKIQVPAFAKKVLVTGTGISAAEYAVKFYGMNPLVFWEDVHFAPGAPRGSIDLPGDCGFVLLRNLGPGPIGSPGMVFEIGL